jgi:hypothetical protein
MCWCTPEIRTPFCGKAGCVPPKQNVQTLVPWGESTAIALIQQVEARRREAEADGSMAGWYFSTDTNWLCPTCAPLHTMEGFL